MKIGLYEILKNRPQQPQKELGEYFQWLHFLNQWLPLIKMHYNVPHLFDFHPKITSGQGWRSSAAVLYPGPLPSSISFVQKHPLRPSENILHLLAN